MAIARRDDVPEAAQEQRAPYAGPGAPQERAIPPELAATLLAGGGKIPPVGAFRAGGDTEPMRPRIGEREIAQAAEILTEYKNGKSNLENRIVEDELWWELRHWEIIRRGKRQKNPAPEPASAWLFNSIMNKHADAMDNYPEPVVLPRERSDEGSAQVLSEILPVILDSNDFEETYSYSWWEKLKHGTGAYGTFWNAQKENGLGDIDIREIDLLKLFWEPGITDIQKSRNLFIVELVDEDILDQRYPEHAGKMGGNVIDVSRYIYDDTVDTSKKCLVVDWYYKRRSANGRTILHYAKFVGTELLFASENEEQYQERGFYDHGLYPVVLDVMFPEKGTPVGFGYVAICKNPQLYIDKMSELVLQNAAATVKKRFFMSRSTNVNPEEFSDFSKDIVWVQGELDDARIREIITQPLSSIYVDLINMKIEEMKDTSSNRDVNSGGTGSGVTAAAAIAALQEAGNKTSRDMIAASYRAHVKISAMCIELMRQFYDETRTFRITGSVPGEYKFVEFNNAGLREQPVQTSYTEQPIYRRPVFDIKIKAQKKNPFSRAEQNQRAQELYQMGFFNPERAQEAIGALEMMEFEGIEDVRERVREGQTLLNICQQMAQQMDQMAILLQSLTGKNMGVDGAASSAGSARNDRNAMGATIGRAEQRAQTPMTDYGTRLAKRSTPDMDSRASGAAPK